MKLTRFPSYIFVLISFAFTIQIFPQSENKIELAEINFVGNDFFTSSELEEIIISKESPNWLSQFLASFSSFGNSATYFDSLTIPNDINILKNYYFSHGFFRTNVNAKYSIDKNGKEIASLTFIINENEPTNFNKLIITGLENISSTFSQKINSIISIDSTVQYSDLKVEQNRDGILSYLQDNGYMLAQADQPIVEIDTIYTNSVNVKMNFKIGTRYKISNISVEKSGPGKNLVSDELIKEIVNIEPENYFSYHNLKLAQVRLYRTNLFSSALITGNNLDTNKNYVPIRIVTSVGLLNELAPEIIVVNDRTESTNFKFGLGLSWINKNFFGDARKLTIGSSISAENITEFLKAGNLADNIYGLADLRATIEQPFLFGKPINTTLETFYTLEKKRDEWNASIYGTKLNLSFELSPYIYLTGLSSHFTLQRTEYIFKEKYIQDILFDYYRKRNTPSVTDEQIENKVDSLYTGNGESYGTNAILGVNLVANKTDDLLFPTKGYSLSILLEDGNSLPYLASKIGNYNFNQSAYYKFVLTSTFYLPILTNYFDAFGTKLRIGNIQSYYGNKKNILFNQRFTAGGSNSIRAWGASDLPVTQIDLPENPTQNEIQNIVRNITPGGFFLLEGSFELREHLAERIGTAIFLDYGNVWQNISDFRFDYFAVAAGFGFRYYSDYAPFRLDFGFKIYDPNVKTLFYKRKLFNILEIQIGIGEAF
ncbi:MAG: BamA/TamA family outer membrane protein [Ignavibacteriae bacterium]|nr:BamA/TamA family outer membrane protein [Ignavibacteriota bacterium]